MTGVSNGKISCGSYAKVKGENTDFAESARIKMCYQESAKSALFYRQYETCVLKKTWWTKLIDCGQTFLHHISWEVG